MSLLHHKYLTCRLNNIQALSTCYLHLDSCREEPAFQICTIFASSCRRTLFWYLLVHFPNSPKPEFAPCWSSRVGKHCLLSLTNPQCKNTQNTTLNLSLKGSEAVRRNTRLVLTGTLAKSVSHRKRESCWTHLMAIEIACRRRQQRESKGGLHNH